MDGLAKETSPAPSISAGTRGFKGLVAKARLGRDKDKDESTVSLNGSDEGEQNGARNSVDSLMERVRDSRRTSVDDNGLPSGPSTLSKLVPGRTRKKRRKREEAEQQQQDELNGRGRSVDDQAATAAASAKLAKDNRSQSTLDEDGGSLITIESNSELPPAHSNPTASPPPLLSHQSHVGYLTSSSPLIKTTITSDAPSNLHLDNNTPEFQNPQYRKSNTFSTSATSSTPSLDLAPQHAATMDVRDGGRSLKAADDRSRSRGVSPGAKIKDVFSIGSKKKNASPPKSPDRASIASDSNGNGLGGFFSKEKRGSVNFGKNKRADTSQLANKGSQSPTTSIPDLPAIITTPNTPTSATAEAPETLVTPPTPTDQRIDPPSSPSLKSKGASTAGTNPNTITSASGNMISHRRVRSDAGPHAPSKLSNTMSAPLTPMVEEARSPGVQGSPGSSAGFFSSVFSAAQNAASQLSDTIAGKEPRSRSSTQTAQGDGLDESDAATPVVKDVENAPIGEVKKLAVDTLGTGNLSLSHLGIGMDNSSTTSLTNGTSEKSASLAQREEAAARVESASAARAVSQAYSDKPVQEAMATPVAEDPPVVRPRSTYESSIMTGDKTPPNGSIHESEATFRRSGSVRSRVGTIAKRHRNSSSATGGTIAAAIASGNSALVNPGASGSTPKLTGFAVASKKRNRDFHNLFRTVPEDDYLIEDYSCALQRDIILAGRIYVSEGHICFSSNILGWVTTLIINFDEIVSVEKENTAMVFPNAIAIQTLHARHTFRSLLSREATYDLLIGIWKINHPSLKSSLNGVRLDQGGTGDKTEKLDPPGEDENSDLAEEEDDEVYDEDEEEEEGTGSFTEVPEGSVAGSEAGAEQAQSAARKASAMGVAVGAAAGGVPTPSDAKAGEKAAAASAASVDYPGPATHAPTECNDVDNHYDKFLKDDVVPAPLGKVYSMVFGPASGGFMAKWLLDEMKCTDLQMDDDKKGLSEENRVRSFSYIKPLYASIGPKSTKCVVTETLDFIDLEKSVSVTASTQTPDVPSGNVFATKTRFCFMWAPGNATRVVMNFNIEWTGKSWLKGPIEKGAADGQKTYGDDLIKALKAGVTSRPRASTNGSKIKKGKRKKGDAGSAKAALSADKPTASVQQQDSSWGLFEPLHGLFGPVIDIFSPIISSNMIIGLLMLFILVNWLRGPKVASSSSLGYPGMSTPQRIAAYEEIWRKEESDLWDWLEERIGMQGIAYPDGGDDQDVVAQARRQREASLKSRGMRKALADVKMSDREVDHAIRTTEERLEALKRAVSEKKGMEGGEGQAKGRSRDEDVGQS